MNRFQSYHRCLYPTDYLIFSNHLHDIGEVRAEAGADLYSFPVKYIIFIDWYHLKRIEIQYLPQYLLVINTYFYLIKKIES